MATRSSVYGLMAEFDDPTTLVAATDRAHHQGYRRMDAYSPFPIEELHDAIGSPPSRLPLIVLICGVLGCIGGYVLPQYGHLPDGISGALIAGAIGAVVLLGVNTIISRVLAS